MFYIQLTPKNFLLTMLFRLHPAGIVSVKAQGPPGVV